MLIAGSQIASELTTNANKSWIRKLKWNNVPQQYIDRNFRVPVLTNDSRDVSRPLALATVHRISVYSPFASCAHLTLAFSSRILRRIRCFV